MKQLAMDTDMISAQSLRVAAADDHICKATTKWSQPTKAAI